MKSKPAFLFPPLRQSTVPGKISDAVCLGVMISNAWPNSRATRGATLEAITRMLRDFPFFSAVQTVDIPFAEERRAIRNTVRGSGRPHTYMLTRVLNENNLNLSALDHSERKRACAKIVSCFDDAEEAGATVIGLVSGARPKPETESSRADALRALEESLATICAAAKPGGLKIEIEPLDYAAHKRATLGTIAEGVAICRNLAAANLHLRLCVDQAHGLLNGEDLVAAIAEARPYMEELHICNAVIDRAHPLFGDRHLPLGAPGFVTRESLSKLFVNLIETGVIKNGVIKAPEISFAENHAPETTRPIISCEVLTPEGGDPLVFIRGYLQTLQDAWADATLSMQQG